ncbi:MAG: hypothetical protein RL499_967 [Actinomycetota bacterium]|jgi:hypothetical protein
MSSPETPEIPETPDVPETAAVSPVRENVLRGTLLALLAVPAGVALWLVIWNLGYLAAIVSFAVALGAAFLYRVGSGGTVSKVGASIVTGIVVVTVLLSFYAGLVSDYANVVASQLDISPFEAMGQPLFWSSFHAGLPVVLEGNVINVGLALLFGVLGSFGVLRAAFQSPQ